MGRMVLALVSTSAVLCVAGAAGYTIQASGERRPTAPTALPCAGHRPAALRLAVRRGIGINSSCACCTSARGTTPL
jgi:hypothetical protein